MPSLTLIRRLPPKLSAWLFYRGYPVALLIRFLLGNIYGVLLLSVAIYIYRLYFSNSQPLSFAEMAVWFDDLSAETKTGLLAASLTIIGFMFAFQTATENWKNEALANIKIHVATEIEGFFAEASHLTSNAEIYANTLVNTIKKIQSSKDQSDINFAVQWAIDRLPAFMAARERLSAMSIEIHRLSGKHFSILATVPGAIDSMEDCAASFEQITKHMWFRLPSVPADHPNPVGIFFSQVNVAECSDFVRCCGENFGRINGLSGGVRGALLAPVIGMRVGTWSSLLGKKDQFVAASIKSRRKI